MAADATPPDNLLLEWLWRVAAAVAGAAAGVVAYAMRLEKRITRLEDRLQSLERQTHSEHGAVLKRIDGLIDQNTRMEQRQYDMWRGSGKSGG